MLGAGRAGWIAQGRPLPPCGGGWEGGLLGEVPLALHDWSRPVPAPGRERRAARPCLGDVAKFPPPLPLPTWGREGAGLRRVVLGRGLAAAVLCPLYGRLGGRVCGVSRRTSTGVVAP